MVSELLERCEIPLGKVQSEARDDLSVGEFPVPNPRLNLLRDNALKSGKKPEPALLGSSPFDNLIQSSDRFA